jgi:hypothetical protein
MRGGANAPQPNRFGHSGSPRRKATTSAAATIPKLGKNTFRASGSRQLDAARLAAKLEEVAHVVKPGGRLHLVDLRQETHLFFNGRAVSWYADKDWANVGQSLEWIEADQQSQLDRIAKFPTTQVFCLNPKNSPGGNSSSLLMT